MTVIATASNPRFSVSRVDIDRPGPDLHHRHAARPARGARGGRGAVLHHRRRRAVPDDVLAGRRGTVLARAFRRLHPAGAPADRRRAARGQGQPDRDPGAGDLVDRVPAAGRRGGADLVPGAGRDRAVHRQAAGCTARTRGAQRPAPGSRRWLRGRGWAQLGSGTAGGLGGRAVSLVGRGPGYAWRDADAAGYLKGRRRGGTRMRHCPRAGT